MIKNCFNVLEIKNDINKIILLKMENLIILILPYHLNLQFIL